ncbi:hypothetical protein ALC53_01215, partial [Atta colombica]
DEGVTRVRRIKKAALAPSPTGRPRFARPAFHQRQGELSWLLQLRESQRGSEGERGRREGAREGHRPRTNAIKP